MPVLVYSNYKEAYARIDKSNMIFNDLLFVDVCEQGKVKNITSKNLINLLLSFCLTKYENV